MQLHILVTEGSALHSVVDIGGGERQILEPVL